MNYYYCEKLDTNVSFVFNETFGFVKEVLLIDDNGVVLFPITVPFSSARKFCAFVDTYNYPWLSDFLIANDIAVPTYKYLIYSGYRCEEFNFRKEIGNEK